MLNIASEPAIFRKLLDIGPALAKNLKPTDESIIVIMAI